MRERNVKVFWADNARKRLAWCDGDAPGPQPPAYYAGWMSGDEETIIFASVQQADIPRRKLRHLLKQIAASK